MRNALKPLLMIVGFTGLGFALLFGLGLLFPRYSVLDWSWVLYLAGCIVIFITLLRKYKSGTLPGNRPPVSEAGTPESSGRDLEAMRKRVRQHKQSRAEENSSGE
jgi:hypothetical protein